MEGRTLLRKSAIRALTTPPSVLTGGVAVASSFMLLNPLPAILWGLGAGVWTIAALSSGRYTNTIIDEERVQQSQRTAADRSALHRRITQTLLSPPFSFWVTRGLPDYLTRYNRLLDLRRRIDVELRHRKESALETGTSIATQLDGMLAAYLRFVWSRIMYIQILTGERSPSGIATDAATPSTSKRSGGFARALAVFVKDEEPEQADTWEERTPTRVDDRSTSRGSFVSCNLEASRQAVTVKLEKLHARIQREPHAKSILESNAKLLDRQLKLLEDCAARDQRVAAQLDAFEDAFDLILSQVSATQFDAGGVVEYMNSLAGEVADTEEFVRTMQPLSDDLLGTMAFDEESALRT